MTKSLIPSTSSRKRRPYLYFFVAGLLLLVVWLGWKSWRVYQLARSLQAHQASAETMLAGGLSQLDPQATELLLLAVRNDVVALRDETAIFMPLLERMAWVPRVGPTLAAAPHLMEMADAGTEGAVYAFSGLKPALVVVRDGSATGSALPEIAHVLQGASVELAQTEGALRRVAEARAAIQNEHALPAQIEALLSMYDERAPLLEDSLALVQIIPEIMGLSGPRSYLIIAQNQDELRATGGYISGAGILTVQDGDLLGLEFLDANLIGDWREKPFDFPPQPLNELMGLELFLFRDVNFWPDFPTTAEQALDLFSYSEDYGPLDGAIAVDQQFVAMLLAATGPVEVSDLALVVNRNNIIQELRNSWQVGDQENLNEWVMNRKDFLGPFAAALRSKLERDLGSIDLLYLADILDRAAAEKHLQVYMRAPEVAAVLDRLNWDGRLENPSGGDFLFVVESNVGYNKVNPAIDTQVDYAVTIQEAGDAEAELRLTYLNNAEASDTACRQGVHDVYRAGGAYEELIQGCYFNYLRVYTPRGSELLSASTFTAPAEAFVHQRGWARPADAISEHPAFTTFENFVLVPQQEQVEVHFAYRLPQVLFANAEAKIYHLRVPVQAGAPARQVRVRITLPEGAELVDVTPEPAERGRDYLSFEFLQETDLEITVTYR